MGGKSSSPDTPDYTGAALAQGQLSKESALSTTGLNRPNQVTPYGKQTWSYTGAPQTNPLMAGLAATPAADSTASATTNGGGKAVATGPAIRDSTGYPVTGAPAGSATGNATWDNMLAQSNAGTIKPGDWTVTTELSPEQQAIYNSSTANKQQSSDLAGKVLSSYGSQAPVVYDENSFSKDRDAVTKSLYDRSTRLYKPAFDESEAAMRSRLVNQGLDENSAAFSSQIRDFNNTKNTAYQNAADNAVVGGGQEQSRMLANLLQSRGSALNEANALQNGGQVTSPNFQGYGGASGYESPDITGATASSYNAALGSANAKNAQTAQTTQGLASLATMLYMFSDRRLKSCIKAVGEGFAGLTIYSYNIFGKPSRGYMADEVQAAFPDAVMEAPNGYLMVNYNAIGGCP